MELNGTTVSSGYDQLNVSGTVDLGGSILNASLGFTPATGLRAGLVATYAWFLAHEPVRTMARS